MLGLQVSVEAPEPQLEPSWGWKFSAPSEMNKEILHKRSPVSVPKFLFFIESKTEENYVPL